MPEVIIDGVRYVPVAESNPSVEQIARGIMDGFWGELPKDLDWQEEAGRLRVLCSDDIPYSKDLPTVMDVVGKILKRIK